MLLLMFMLMSLGDTLFVSPHRHLVVPLDHFLSRSFVTKNRSRRSPLPLSPFRLRLWLRL